MAGGEKDDLEKVRGVLEPLGSIVHVGGPGAGHTAKIVNQVIVGLVLEAIAEALALAERGSVRTMLKDGRLGLSLAASVGVELSHLRSLVDVWSELTARGHAGDDCSVLIMRLLDATRPPT